MRTYRQLFGVTEFRAIFTVQCLAVGSASVSSLALGTVTYTATRNPVLTGLAMFGGPLIRMVASWFLVSASDLLRPRTALAALAIVTCVADLLQAVPGLAWGLRFVILALPWVVMSATGGSTLALVADILPDGSYVFGRATLNIAVGGMQIVGYGLSGILLLRLSTSTLFLCAAAAAAVAIVIVARGVGQHASRAAGGSVVRRAQATNRALLGSSLLRPVFLAGWIPNGLIVGCESLFVPLAGRAAGYLFATTAAGMLTGDILIGRFVTGRLRRTLVGPLRFLLAVPYVLFLFHPALAVAAGLGFFASIGYAASLPLQERLVDNTSASIRGQVLGLNSAGVTAMQGVAAVLAGLLTERLAGGPAAAIGVLGCTSLVITVALIPGLRRSRPGHAATPAAGPAPDPGPEVSAGSVPGQGEMQLAGPGRHQHLTADRQRGERRGVAHVDVGQDRQAGEHGLPGDDLLKQRPGQLAGPLESADQQPADAGRGR
jgi:hypothetical protein